MVNAFKHEIIEADVLHDALAIVGYNIPISTLRDWPMKWRRVVLNYVAAVHFSASDNDVEVPPKPEYLNDYIQE